MVIQPYRGFGSSEEFFMAGRVFRQTGRSSRSGRSLLIRDVIDTLRRVFRTGVSEAILEVRTPDDKTLQITTDRRGHFQIHAKYAAKSGDGLWQSCHLELIRPEMEGAEATGQIFVLPHSARFGVISDIDDTVVFTGVSNKLLMIWRLFMQNARSRVAFPGVAAFYRALHHGGTAQDEANPMLYVSRGPWSIYDILDEFFRLHRIPAGPVLFLRDWALTYYRLLPPKAKKHKFELIDRILSIYRDLPFILIGDSGQRDPEIYTDVVRNHPGRILAIYIRNIHSDANRNRSIRMLAEEVAPTGTKLMLAADSFAMAEHAIENGYISPAAMGSILRERQREGAAE